MFELACTPAVRRSLNLCCLAVAFLQKFVEGAAEAKSLDAALSKHETRFMGARIIQGLPAPLQAEWHRALRAVMAGMIHHTGLSAAVSREFDPVYSAWARDSKVVEQKQASAPAALSLSLDELRERLRLIAVSAKGLQEYMLSQVQRERDWSGWFGAERMRVSVERVAVNAELDDIDIPTTPAPQLPAQAMEEKVLKDHKSSDAPVTPPVSAAAPSQAPVLSDHITYTFKFGFAEFFEA